MSFLTQCQTGVSQNNQAAELILRGEYQAASAYLSNALSEFKAIMGQTMENHNAAKNLMENQPNRLSLDSCMNRRLNVENSNLRLIPSKTEEIHASRRSAYVHPAFIPEDISETDYKASVTISAIIVFNLALAVHLSAESTGNNPSTLLKAIKLYELAFAMTQNDTSCAGGASPSYVLAVANNMGVIYSQLNDIENARKCFQLVMSTLMYLVEYDVHHNVVDFELFLGNATACEMKANAPCAAWAPAA
eukprot:Nitzschia sp. Nitz4//scaffold99_size76975//72434//73177//NITZ4_005588-RA/size76975-processed-gene-0.55-mRNA-1//-1//CDS//3329560886//3568//frame0